MQVLATGLSALYSSLPRKIEVRADDWHSLRREDWMGVPALVLFMNSLEFCNAVLQLCMVSLSLFRTLLNLNCEDVMLQLVLSTAGTSDPAPFSPRAKKTPHKRETPVPPQQSLAPPIPASESRPAPERPISAPLTLAPREEPLSLVRTGSPTRTVVEPRLPSKPEETFTAARDLIILTEPASSQTAARCTASDSCGTV
ncbi:FTS and Hook-interacting protein like protein [Chelonia mydas]|uniref:FTS and Hook-interacting protein like protein n=1 Tax=Chelonia mydas TaxID=8469 RepID=M7BU55_CHEMY|nr:FTS and Hook-interacting protein like protein [Chelonia mydas]